MINKKLFLAISLIFLANQCFACDNVQIEYFAWAGLKTIPASVSDPLTEIEAKQRHGNGASYYEQQTCDSGQVMSLTKYYAGKVFFHTEYLHQADGSILVTTTNPDGQVTKHHAK